MAETKRPSFLETLRAGWQPAQKRAKTTSSMEADAAKASASTTTASQAAAAKPEGAKTDGAKETATKEATAGKRKLPAPNLEERMEGVQGWMAEIERKQGRMTYFGGAAVLLALAAAGVAIYLGVTAKSDSADSATKEDLDALEEKVDGLQKAVTKNTQSTQQTLNQTVAGLQTSIDTLTKQQAQNKSAISALQSQGKVGAAGVTPTPTAPTPTPTTPAPGAKQP